MATISGEIRDENNDLLADCVVRVYRRDTGALLVAGVSGDGLPETVGDEHYDSVVLSLHMDGTDGGTTFTDSSATPKTVTANGNARIESDQSKFGGTSGYFYAYDDYLTIPYDASLSFGTGDFTVEMWLRMGIANRQNAIMSSSEAGGFGLVLNSAYNTIGLAKVGSGYLVQFAGHNIQANTWTHVEVTRSGSSNYCFINGTQIDTTKTNSESWVCGATGFKIHAPSGLYDVNTIYIDDLRITNGVARHTANFTPPTATFADSLGIPARPLGEYTLTTGYADEVQVIALDPNGGTTLNDLILRTTPV